MLEKFKRLKQQTSSFLKHKKKVTRNDIGGLKKGRQQGESLNKAPLIEVKPQIIKGDTSRPKKIRRVFKTDDQIEIKIKDLKEKVAALTGKDNKNKRTRIYNEISRLNKALTNPEVYKKDPVEEEKKRQNDIQKRIEKKKTKKQDLVNLIRLEKKYSAKVICYICKGKGHQAKDCTQANLEVSGVDMNTKICYNCGSVQHTLKDCRKKRKETLPFALCFVCKEAGHIARDCPQNEKGLYAHGGGCYICNSVRHIARDCPDSEENRRKAEALEAKKAEKEANKAEKDASKAEKDANKVEVGDMKVKNGKLNSKSKKIKKEMNSNGIKNKKTEKIQEQKKKNKPPKPAAVEELEPEMDDF